MTTSSASSSSTAAIVATAAAVAATAILGLVSYRRYLQERDHAARTKYVEQELEKDALEQETIPSIIEQFSDFVLTPNTTISEANKRRTTNYYQKARDAHLYDLVPGIKSYPRLRNRRAAALQQTMRYYREGLKSHRTVLAMCDPYTAQLLQQARADILEPLAFSTDETTRGVWIPQENIIPLADLHVTVAIPWWWQYV
jgi:type II secretory pathway pseudopilin PulG